MIWMCLPLLRFLAFSLFGFIVAFILLLVVVYLRQLPFRRSALARSCVRDPFPLLRYIGVHLSLLEISKHCGSYDTHLTNFLLFEASSRPAEGWVMLFIGVVPELLLYRADHVEKVFGNSKNIRKGPSYRLLDPWLGEGLLTSYGSKWKSRRKFLTPAFHFKVLDTFADAMNRQAKIFADQIGRKKPDEDMLPYVEAFTLDVVCETIMGIDMKCQLEGSGRDYLNKVKRISHQLVKRFADPLSWIDFIYFNFTGDGREFKKIVEEVHDFTTQVINERKRELSATPEILESISNAEEAMTKSKKPFLDLMLVEHLKTQNLSIEDIREEVDTFMFEGHDTTSMGLTWTLHFIGLHQDVQAKLHEEIDRVFQGNSTCDVTAEHIKELKYLEMVIKESQRLCPSVPFAARLVTEEFRIDDKPVPIGTEVIVFIRKLHEDPKVFPKPHEFDPQRFSAENSRNRNPYAFVPFSAGPRNCIGQKFALLEEKILLVWVLRKFQIKSLDYRDQILVKIDIVLRPQSPIRIAVKNR
ncbi:cytochrome P450 4V2-like [Galendromus occidentalis]|uniref:Cytochrome P450 4V2-like n=1 Tax=Galendromus occidentalis TaxID=34638 RepID=A0AAJ7SHM7_9ACAR|nr:cytochrome P450 4V2-like [Galendromus occidentalis]